MTAEELNLKDGEYTAEVTMEGGSGRATIDSPTAVSEQKSNDAASWWMAEVHRRTGHCDA